MPKYANTYIFPLLPCPVKADDLGCMKPSKSKSRQGQTTRRKRTRHSQKGMKRVSARQQDERDRVFEALNLYRSGKAKSAYAAARMARTTLRTMKKRMPEALSQNRRGGRIHIKARDSYPAKVQILTHEGAITAVARGSHQRELAGRHRATAFLVLARKRPASALNEYHGKKVGGYELISDYRELSVLARAGVLGQLDTLYVSPDTSV